MLLGSILGPVLFIIYMYDVIECCKSSGMCLYADNSKIFKCIRDLTDSWALQKDTDCIKECLNEGLVTLNVGKCKQISDGLNIRFCNRYLVKESDKSIGIDKPEATTDFEVTFDSKLKLD
jgi:hypothetical protein